MKEGEDHVHTILDTEFKISLVLLRKGRKINCRLGKVNSLARRKGTVVERADMHVRSIDRSDKKR